MADGAVQKESFGDRLTIADAIPRFILHDGVAINPRLLAMYVEKLSAVLKISLKDTKDVCICNKSKKETCWLCEANEILNELGYIN